MLTCSKFLTTSDYVPRLQQRLATEELLIADAAGRGWDREAERRRATRRRLSEILADLSAGCDADRHQS